MRQLVSIGLLAAGVWVFGARDLHAQTADQLKRLSLQELLNIDVTSVSKEPTAKSRTPAAVFVITGDDIRRSGATSLPEALRMAPGVEVARIDGNKWSIGIRGFGSRLTRSVLVLIDGRTVYTPLFDGTYWEVQDTLLEDVDRIEVVRGPGGTIWGPNAVNGVINIITKVASDTQGLLVSAGSGNEERGFANVRAGGTSAGGVSYRVYAKGFFRSAQSHDDGENFDNWRSAQGGFRMDWKGSDRDAFTLQGDLYRQRAGESVEATSYTPPFSQIVNADARLSGANLMARWKRIVNADDDIQIQAYYDRTDRQEPNFGETRTTFDVDFLQRFRPQRRHQLTWGLGARLSPVDDTEVVSGLTFLPSQRTDQLFTAFVQDEIALVPDRLSLTLGTKLLRTNFTDFGIEPSGRVLWTITGKQSVWTAYTHALRTPSDAEENFFLSGFAGTASDGTPIMARFNANPGFEPEKLDGYELGYRDLLRDNLSIDVAAFYNRYRDLFSEDITGPIFFEATPGTPHFLLPARFGNGLQATTKGVEIAPEWRLARSLRVRGSYSFLHMDVERGPNSLDIGSAPGIEGSSPQHQVGTQVALDVANGVELDFDYRFVSALPAQNVPRYSTANARLGWRLSPQLAVSLVGQNLLQSEHAELGGDPGAIVMIKRSAYVNVTWRR